jgi:hypothetical protein
MVTHVADVTLDNCVTTQSIRIAGGSNSAVVARPAFSKCMTKYFRAIHSERIANYHRREHACVFGTTQDGYKPGSPAPNEATPLVRTSGPSFPSHAQCTPSPSAPGRQRKIMLCCEAVGGVELSGGQLSLNFSDVVIRRCVHLDKRICAAYTCMISHIRFHCTQHK